jgi:D-lactate dehydrogenase
LNILTDIPGLHAGFPALGTDFFTAGDILTAPEDCWAYVYKNSRCQVLPQASFFPVMPGQALRF